MEIHNVSEMKVGNYYILDKGIIGQLYYKFHYDHNEGSTEVQFGTHFHVFSPEEGEIDDLFIINEWYYDYEHIDIERLKIIPEIYIKKNIPKELIDIIYSYIF
jgi:hypothetical protein|uniref:Uncharacterized protein n=1 Tax=viral metagenome TaxID=1070528 RepID=A0A6C0CZH7_9ZZZZ